MLTVGSLFSGIGGFELGLERTGCFKTSWQCEKDEFCLKVLAKHWPDVKRFTDIKEMGIEENIPYVDVICGGFPCQPVSCAGKRKGKEDKRWLWPEFYRIVCQVKPRWVLVENVPGLLSADSGRLFAGILRDLASSGYDAEWNIVSAASVGAPHLRKRVFVVAHTKLGGIGAFWQGEMEGRASSTIINSGETSGDVADPNQIGRHGRAGVFGQGGRQESEDGGAKFPDTQGERLERRATSEHEEQEGRMRFLFTGQGEQIGGGQWTIEPSVGRAFDGIPCGLDDYWRPGWEDGTSRLAIGQKDRVNRLKALGNAIVPQCAEFVGRCILEAEARQ